MKALGIDPNAVSDDVQEANDTSDLSDTSAALSIPVGANSAE
jgi:hypothetical protein